MWRRVYDESGRRQGSHHGGPCRTLARNLDFILRTMGGNLRRILIMGIPCTVLCFKKLYLYTKSLWLIFL